MRYMRIFFVVILFFVSLLFSADKSVNSSEPENDKISSEKEKQETSYCLGMDVGNAIKSQEIELDLELFIQGLKDAVVGKKSRYTDEEFNQIMERFRKKQMELQQKRFTKMAEENQKKGTEYLEENKKKKGVQVTPSGLQYRILKQGNGPKPKINDMVEVHYTGRFVDGKVFDSSVQRGQPAVFPVDGIIPGWSEALLMMNVGSKWELTIPANLAYGERGAGPIPPNSVLIFEVELLSIKPPSEQPPPPPTRKK